MNPVLALALRRALLAGGMLGASIAGHVAATGGLEIIALTPFLWIGLVGFAAAVGGLATRGAAFVQWGLGRILTVLLAGQAVLHVGMDVAPWAFGIAGHPHGALVTPAVALLHIGLAMIVASLTLSGQRVLSRAIEAVRSLFSVTRRPALPRPLRRHVPFSSDPARTEPREPRSSRGPPGFAPRPA